MGVERRNLSGFFSDRSFGAAFTAGCRGSAGGTVDVAASGGEGRVRGGYGELCRGVGGAVDAWDGAGAICHVVGTVGAVGVVKAGGAVCTTVVSGIKGVVVVGTRCGAGTA